MNVKIKDVAMHLHEEQAMKKFETKDVEFNRIIIQMDRLLKLSGAQTLTCGNLEKKIRDLSNRDLTHPNSTLDKNYKNHELLGLLIPNNEWLDKSRLKWLKQEKSEKEEPL